MIFNAFLRSFTNTKKNEKNVRNVASGLLWYKEKGGIYTEHPQLHTHRPGDIEA